MVAVLEVSHMARPAHDGLGIILKQLSTVYVLLASLVAAGAHAAGSPQESASPVDQFNETVAVCVNLDMYPVMAARNRDEGMPLDISRDLVVASMEKNFAGKLPPGVLEPTIDVVKDIYGRIYADPKPGPEAFNDIVFESCSGYRGYAIDKAALKAELAGYVQSAFNPFARVPLCIKAGQSAANIAQARDNGMTKERITAVVADALNNDPATLAIAPTIIDEVYSLKDLEVISFYGYNVHRCEARKAGATLPPLASLEARVEQCEQLATKEAQKECLESAFSVNAKGLTK